MGSEQQYRPGSNTSAPAASVLAAEAAHAAPQSAATGAGGVGAAGLGGADPAHPRLNSFWNFVMGGQPGASGEDRPNHIGSTTPSPVTENGRVSNGMRNVPYLGDYWEALSVTHDSTHQKGLMNEVTAITDVALPGPLMALADAPARLFGHSMFLDRGK